MSSVEMHAAPRLWPLPAMQPLCVGEAKLSWKPLVQDVHLRANPPNPSPAGTPYDHTVSQTAGTCDEESPCPGHFPDHCV